MKKVHVFVVGECGSGKTTIARLLETALKNVKVKVKVEDLDPPPNEMVMAMRLENFNNEREVTVETVQVRRRGQLPVAAVQEKRARQLGNAHIRDTLLNAKTFIQAIGSVTDEVQQVMLKEIDLALDMTGGFDD